MLYNYRACAYDNINRGIYCLGRKQKIKEHTPSQGYSHFLLVAYQAAKLANTQNQNAHSGISCLINKGNDKG